MRSLLDAGSFEDLPGKWQAAILEAEQNRPKLRLIGKRLKNPLAVGPRLSLGVFERRLRLR